MSLFRCKLPAAFAFTWMLPTPLSLRLLFPGLSSSSSCRRLVTHFRSLLLFLSHRNIAFSTCRMLFLRLSLGLLFFLPYFVAEPRGQELNPLKLLRKDLESLNCLFFRRNCTNHLADLASANRLFWKIMTAPATGPKLNTVRLEVYMESQCPDTSRFIRGQLLKAWASLGHTGRIDLTIVPFGKARCVEKGNDYTCSCQHGPNECELNQLMNCVIEKIGFPDRIVPVINCIQGKGNLDQAMAECITPNKLFHSKQIQECAAGPRGRRLLAMAGARTVALKPALNFVPWIMIDGERNSDALYDLTENLCRSLEPGPEECAVYEKKDEEKKK